MKLTDKIRKQAAELAQKHGFSQLWVNEKGEFFSNQSYAVHSVGGDKSKWTEVPIGVAVETNATNDLGKAADVIAAIEKAETAEEVRAILDAEVAGKNRKSVIEAGDKKLISLGSLKIDTPEQTDDDSEVIEENLGAEPLNTGE